MLLLVKLLCRRVPKSDINGIDGYKEKETQKNQLRSGCCLIQALTIASSIRFHMWVEFVGSL